jgi:hypothetical protein
MAVHAPLPIPRPIPERSDIDPASFASDVVPAHRPVVLRGLGRDWPAVAAARRSTADLVAYLARFDSGRPIEAFVAPAAVQGRYFYTEDMHGFNFERQQGSIAQLLDFLMRASSDPAADCLYVGAAPTAEILPGFDTANPMPLLSREQAMPRAWIGNRSTVAAHFDLSDNIALVVAGRRRFTLFPPEQIGNLYIGPIDHTMAGQPASMVSLHEPDLDRFPRFADAMAAAFTAELDPGDAIYIPSLWWHHVDALSPLNMLLNYWTEPPADAGSPFEAMIHSLMEISALPAPQRDNWRRFFDHYVFRPERDPTEHIAPAHRGILGEQTRELRVRLRHFLLRALNRG